MAAGGEDGPADIALIGMACLFPGAADVRRYWQNICRGADAVREVPPDRWRADDFYDPDRQARDRVYSRWGAFLDPVAFDPVKWHIPPASLRHVEPMQLLALEVARRALADAGHDDADAPRGAEWKERAGVLFALPGSHELGGAYSFRTMMRHYLPQVEGLTPEAREQVYAGLEAKLPEWTEDSFPGFLSNVTAGRIARAFDFHGPNFAVDAACAASLAALFTAVGLLRAGTADLMLVGGADGTNNPFGFMSFARTYALSPRGRCRAFDASGDGIALGEGVAAVVLKRLADARRDGDRVDAVIKGVGCSSDGKNRSLTAPHPPGQARAVRRAYEDAGLSPAAVTLIEAHGTGTAVGDAAELATLTEVFAPHTDDRRYVAVGSVKSMIGHTKTAAGLASLIKAALALRHRVLPPTLHVETPNPAVAREDSPFYLNTETRPWLAEGGQPRRAGVSSFGFGGTNFHVVLEEAPSAAAGPNWTPRGAELFLFRRADREAMARDLRRLLAELDAVETDDLAGLAAAVCAEESGRVATPGGCRLAVVAASVVDFRQKLRKAVALLPQREEGNDPAGVFWSESAPASASALCFLYPGQGSQAVNMLRDLLTGCPWADELCREANGLPREDLSPPLTRHVYPPPVFDEAERRRQSEALRDTRVAQPALGLVELFATELLARFGVRPAFAAGHSYGELPALYAAGCLSRGELLRLSARRGRVCAEAAAACPGAMASVPADAERTEQALRELGGPVRVANRNAPDQTVVAGPAEALDRAVEELNRRGLRARKLSVSAAFHTPLLAGAAESMRACLAGVALQAPRLPVYSNTTGGRHGESPEGIRDLLARHLCEPVLFERQVRRLHADGARVFVEVGPGRVLTDLVSRILPGGQAVALPLDAAGRDGWTQLGHTLARLAVLGLPLRVEEWFSGRGLAAVPVADFLAGVRAAATPKPTDWMLSPNRAEPVTPAPPVPTAANGEVNMPRTNADAGRPASDLFAQFQETTRLLLETQQTQARVLERYLEMQEKLLLQAGGGLTPAVPVQQRADAPRPPEPRRRPPVPIPRGTDVPALASPRPAANGTPPAPPPVAAEGDGPPPTETFRRDLLAVVSARTGYPVDALDENLALEAELGIDSIKTVEIFSNLKAYHAYFRAEEQEEEELLAEFTRLKTLRDIIDSYDRRRRGWQAPAERNGHAPEGTNGVAKTGAEVRRYEVAPVEAPDPSPSPLGGEGLGGRGDGEKKNGLTG